MQRIAGSINKTEITNYLLVWGLIAVSGFPYFYTTQAFIVLLLLIATYVFLKKSIVFNTRSLIIFGAFFTVELLQLLIFKPFDFKLLAGTYMRLAVGFIIICICKEKFPKYYVNVIYFFCIVSYFFFIPSVISSGFYKFFLNSVCPHFYPPYANEISIYEFRPSVILFTFDAAIPEYRNPGPFWEQGAFAIFILIAMLFNLIIEKKMWTSKNIVFSITLISTLSTSGFIAFFVLMISFYLVNESFVKKLLFLAIALPLAVTLYFSLDFLNAKIQNNIAIADEDTSSRFGSAVADLKEWSTSPWIGWGRGSMRFGGKKIIVYTREYHRNNGITGFLATFGILLFIFFFYQYYKSLRYICFYNSFNTHFAVFGLIVIMLLGFSQTIFQYPFFYSIMFIHFGYTVPVRKTRRLKVLNIHGKENSLLSER